MFKKKEVFKCKILGRTEMLKMSVEIFNGFYPAKAELMLPPYFHQLLEQCNALSANCFKHKSKACSMLDTPRNTRV